MKAFSCKSLFFAIFSMLGPAFAHADRGGGDPLTAGPFTELRKSPLFQAPALSLAKTWGPAIPPNTPFQVEKVYGRWVFGRPTPLAQMKAKDFAPSGWVFSRNLLIRGDTDTINPLILQQGRSVIYHSRALNSKEIHPALDFLETLVLSKRTLEAFSRPESNATGNGFKFFPEAHAEEENPGMGLTGTELNFLNQEIRVLQERSKARAKAQSARILKPPPLPPLDENTRAGILGRFMMSRYLELPNLSMEEVDGHIYLRAIAMRSLRGCSPRVQNFWKNRRWSFFRVYRLKSRPEIRHPWFEVSFPGGYFAVSGRAIELASNEAELAFLLARQMSREARMKKKHLIPDQKTWPKTLSAKAEEVWDSALRAQSTKDAPEFDVADEIATDLDALECISRAGYQGSAGISYLKKMAMNRDASWAAWYKSNSLGLDYRIERSSALLEEAIAQGKFPSGKEFREKRFSVAVKQWNLLP